VRIHSQFTAVLRNIQQVMVGQEKTIRHALCACLAGGHILLEDVPGTGKTTLANAIAKSLGLDFNRIQGTPDLLPGELTGAFIYQPKEGTFQFRKGPIFTQLLLMDEINRATPRTQSALLEAMAEHQVTVDGQSMQLGQPFFVIATANPIESQGVFPLPEAQIDRFLVQLSLGYINEDEEIEMVKRVRLGQKPSLEALMTVDEVRAAQNIVHSIHVSEEIVRYIVQCCRATRLHEQVILGASPRSILLLTAFAQSLAFSNKRNYVIPDDVREAWYPVMRHRIRMKVQWNENGTAQEISEVLEEVIRTVEVPTEFVIGYSL